MEVRTAQGAIAWVVALNTMPYVSVPAYWMFGQRRFQGYVLQRRTAVARIDPTLFRVREHFAGSELLASPERQQALLVERLARLPFTTGNDVELLIDGPATFASIFDGIEQAAAYVLVGYYILRHDAVGRELQAHLIAKAREGVRVFVIYDEVGSFDLDPDYLGELRDGGVEVRAFNTTQGRANRWQINFRNHRKIVVTDGQAAWVGGHNIGDEYLGLDPEGRRWRDTHVKITGPAVLSVQMAFLEDWQWACQETLDLDWIPQAAASGVRQDVLIMPTGPADVLETCPLFFLPLINRATTRLWIASPYFVPDEQVVSALQLAALRGVDVRILIPDKADGFLVDLSAWSYLPALEKVGIRVFRHQEGFMHQKVTLMDDLYATVGTANFDNRSFRLNFEITVLVADEDFARQVHDMLEQDFADAREVHTREFEQRSFGFRLAVRLARLLAPIQ